MRIVQVSSGGHNFATDIKEGVNFTLPASSSVNRDFGSPWKRYGQSKLANILFARELANRLAPYHIWSSALHPGNINTELNRGTVQSYPWMKPFMGVAGWFLVTPYKGAITPLYCATAGEIETKNLRCVPLVHYPFGTGFDITPSYTSGQYFVPLAKRENPSELAQDNKLASQLWEFSEAVVRERLGNLS